MKISKTSLALGCSIAMVFPTIADNFGEINAKVNNWELDSEASIRDSEDPLNTDSISRYCVIENERTFQIVGLVTNLNNTFKTHLKNMENILNAWDEDSSKRVAYETVYTTMRKSYNRINDDGETIDSLIRKFAEQVYKESVYPSRDSEFIFNTSDTDESQDTVVQKLLARYHKMGELCGYLEVVCQDTHDILAPYLSVSIENENYKSLYETLVQNVKILKNTNAIIQRTVLIMYTFEAQKVESGDPSLDAFAMIYSGNFGDVIAGNEECINELRKSLRYVAMGWKNQYTAINKILRKVVATTPATTALRSQLLNILDTSKSINKYFNEWIKSR